MLLVCSFISVEGSQDGAELSEREAAALEAARGAISAAGVALPFSAASSRLPPAALEALVEATVWASEAVGAPSNTSHTAEVRSPHLPTHTHHPGSYSPSLRACSCAHSRLGSKCRYAFGRRKHG